MIIADLSTVSLRELTQTFNEAFSDYLVPLQVTEAQLSEKIAVDQIRLELSAGAFLDNRLIGFILHGIEHHLAWNGGTGVIPTQRGKGITHQLYQYILPCLRQAGIQKTQLEVLEHNTPAIRVYQKNGFVIQRELDCFSGEVKAKEVNPSISIEVVASIPKDWQQNWRNWEPSFQHRDAKVQNLGDRILHLVAYYEGQAAGYLLADKAAGKPSVYQFAVTDTHRQLGIGRALFQHLAKTKTVPLRVINVDHNHQASLSFLKALGLDRPFRQFEMARII